MNPTTNKKARARFSNPLAEVRMEPIEINGEKINRFGIQVLDDEGSWRTQHIVGPDYQLVTNALALQVGEDVVSRSPLAWEPVKTLWNGKFMSAQYVSDLSVEVPKVGDAIRLGMRIENSYDGTAKLRASLMAFVLSCTNGLMHPSEFGSYTFKHVAKEEFDIEDVSNMLLSGSEVLERIAPRLSVLGTVPLDLPHIVKASKALPMPKNNFVDALRVLDRPKETLWTFMQALTSEASHRIPGVASLSQSTAIGKLFLDDFAVIDPPKKRA